MKKFKALYKGMNDDLKDAEMMIDYAYCIRKENEGDEALVNEIARYAQYRLEHFSDFHNLFKQEAAKSKLAAEETVQNCMWEETHEMFQDWRDKIKRKIEKF